MISIIVGLVVMTLIIIIGHLIGALDFSRIRGDYVRRR